MESASRHQCFIYDGAPSRSLPALVAIVCEKLKQDYRCICMNSRPMVAGMRSYLAAAGLDVEFEIEKTNLVLSSEQQHLVDGHFNVDEMMHTLRQACNQALQDGYAGLWATGDMTWEFGPDKDFSKLVEYEYRLEEFFHEHAEFSGICQYHASTLPREILRQGLLVHPSVFVNETLTLMNPHHIGREAFTHSATRNQQLESFIIGLCSESMN